jgi:hypothetical protein
VKRCGGRERRDRRCWSVRCSRLVEIVYSCIFCCQEVDQLSGVGSEAEWSDGDVDLYAGVEAGDELVGELARGGHFADDEAKVPGS